MIAMQAEPRARSHSTTEQRELVYSLIAARPGGKLEAATPFDARAELGLDGEDGMPMGTFKSALAHLIYPDTEQGEHQRVVHRRDGHSLRTKSSPPPHTWHVVNVAPGS